MRGGLILLLHCALYHALAIASQAEASKSLRGMVHPRQQPVDPGLQQCFAPQAFGAIDTALGSCIDGELQRSVDTLISPSSIHGCDLKLPTLGRPSCSMECGPGEYLSADQGGGICRKCPAGTFSLGQGTVLDHFARMPSQLTSTCFSFDLELYYSGDGNVWKENVNCAKWETSEDGSYLHSGNNQNLDYIENYLILHLHFVRKGTIWFTFKVCDWYSFFSSCIHVYTHTHART
jgi:hypothetical protein